MSGRGLEPASRKSGGVCMKVRELIEELKKVDQEARVVVRGYEGGVNDVEILVPVKIALNVHRPADYNGMHEIVFKEYEEKEGLKKFEQVQAIWLRVREDYLDGFKL